VRPDRWSRDKLVTAADKSVRRCRRRGAALQSAIFDAVLEQLSTVGFAAMTMEGVAASAHTGKAAIYRRWASKEDLVAATIDAVMPSFELPLDTGSARADFAEVMRRMAAAMDTPAGSAMQSLFGELDAGHDFIKTLREQVFAPRKAMVLEILRRGVARGDVRPDAVKPVVAEAGPALLVHRMLMYGPPIEPAFIEEVLNEVVMPLIRPQRSGPATRAK
jgi:AcrR family transcriptional regulator